MRATLEAHQGTRFEASEYVVRFLYEVATAGAVSDRHDFIWLLVGLAVGDTDSQELPFDPNAVFGDASAIDTLDAAYVREQVRRFYSDEDRSGDEITLMDRMAVACASKSACCNAAGRMRSAR